MYGASANGPSVCPGEESCERWASTAAKSHSDRERKACHSCDLFPTKLDQGAGHEHRLEMVKRAMQIRRERISGYPRSPYRMSNREFHTLLLLDDLIEERERVLAVKTLDATEAMAGLKALG